MKKIITVIILLVSLQSQAQTDSSALSATANIKARDLEYIGSFIFIDNEVENLYDSIKVKFRVQNPPTGNTIATVTATNADWLYIIRRLKNDATAIKANCTSRVETALRAAGQSWLVSELNKIDYGDQTTFSTMRQFGRQKLRRNIN